MNVATTANGTQERRAVTLVMACVGVFVAYLPVTSVSVSLPAIQRALGASTSELSWVSDAFVLPMAALILTAGVFGDVHGRKKVFQAGLAFTAVGAATALCAQSVEVVWTGQALAGIGAAALLPTTLAMISQAVPDPRERGKFVGLWASSLMAALAVGPLISGVILAHTDWRWIYLPSIPVALLAMAVAARLVTDSRSPHARALDWPGQITATVAITALVYGVIEGGAGSFTDTRVLVALALAVVGLIAFVVFERRSASPMLDLKLFRSAGFSATSLIAMITFMGLIGFFFVLSLYFGMVQQLDTLDAGYRLLMVTGVCFFVGPVAGRVMHRISPRVLISVGLLCAAGALFSLTSLTADTSFGPMAWRLALLGLGMGLVVTPMTATAVSSVPHHLAGMAAAGNNALRQVGGALGPAILGALLTSKSTGALSGHLADAGVTGNAAERIVGAAEAQGLGAVAQLDLGADRGRALGALSESFLDGMQLCLIVAGSLAVLAALVGVVLLRRPKPTPRTAPAPEPVEAVDAHEPALSGTVRDASGVGLAGAVLTLISPTGRQLARAVAGADGQYRVPVPGPGAHVLITTADGHHPHATNLVLDGRPTEHDILLSGAGSMTGKVVGADDGLPLAHAVVTVTDARGDVLATGLTDASGSYVFGDIAEGEITISVTAEGFRPTAVAARAAKSATVQPDIALRPGVRLRGQIRTRPELRPLSDARVTLLDAAGNVVGTSTTGSDGAYAFGDLDAGEYSLVASGYPASTRTVSVNGRAVEALDLDLTHPHG
ncbi:MFS transporter [Streptomyces endophyticus]|uniref:alpha-amylase n=1 Tax=Streptomyces endophyticus TaxID=714166 RepID=A0ABU6F1A6_9ACTN|nr:DHA2 family efflux MFS transporter permease subunit [Streptomyces endophyticus]MEB8337779.1 DHA2 family efflux MFS transporter permease subunit [Streptomyces endophyticus]